MKTIVLSGFKSFGDYVANSSELIVRRLNLTTLASFRVRTILFDANIPETDRGEEIFRFAQSMNASGIISLGMASEKWGLCVECVAVNRVYNTKYVPAEMNGKPINKCKAYGDKVTINLAPWNLQKFLEVCVVEDVPIMRLSHDAGGFCCNHLMYQLHQAQLTSKSQKKIRAIFLHIPCSLETISNLDYFIKSGKVTMDIDEVIRGLALLLENSLI